MASRSTPQLSLSQFDIQITHDEGFEYLVSDLLVGLGRERAPLISCHASLVKQCMSVTSMTVG